MESFEGLSQQVRRPRVSGSQGKKEEEIEDVERGMYQSINSIKQLDYVYPLRSFIFNTVTL